MTTEEEAPLLDGVLDAEVVVAAPVAAMGACPINDAFLPPEKKKHVDPKAPIPMRMMAAKTMVPLSPADMVGVLFMLTFDPEAQVRTAAAKSAAELPDRILATALRDEAIKSPVLGWLLSLHWQKDQYAELLVLNSATPDEAVAAVASQCSVRVAEIIGNNQLRFLRHDEILRQLALNPNAQGALIDGVCDFAVRSGMQMQDVAQMQQARVRLYGANANDVAPDPGPTADAVMQEFAEVADEKASPMEEGKRLTFSQRIMKMNISEKIKLATKGNKEARSILIRDSNKLVSVAVIVSPRITDGEVLVQASNKTCQDDVLRVIYSDREWTKSYLVKLALVKNPKVPQAIGMKLLSTLRESDIKGLARDKNVPNVIQMMAKKMMDKKEKPSKDK
jgi:hypothetical protein